MEILKNVSVDWLGKKWYFISISLVLLAFGVFGYVIHREQGGLALGIDFKGGTVVTLKFNQTPDLDRIRQALDPEAVGATVIQRFGDAADNSILVRMQGVFGAGENVDAGHKALQAILRRSFDPEHVDSPMADFNDINLGLEALSRSLIGADPENLASQGKTAMEVQTHYRDLAKAILSYRNSEDKGLVASLDELASIPGVTPAVLSVIKKNYYTGPFAVTGVDSIGAVVGSDLRNRATLAVGLSLLGMLVYIGFRFKPIYGVGAIVALFHDVLITLGLFALTQKEISLTVIAALLTLVGYSVNDTIVVFDRVRENLRIMRKDTIRKVLNVSINQTLARTIMTSGMTFISVLALLVFGGEVLSGFSFALTVGIIVGTYSSIAIASPIVDWWYRTTEQKPKRKPA